MGDICRYISSPVNGGPRWVEGDWRMPTYAEMKTLYAEAAIRSSKGGNFADLIDDLNTSANIYMQGFFNPASGWWIGADVASTPGNMAVPPDGTIFLPVAGHRYPNGDGDVVQTGAYGYYWTSTPYTQFTVNYLFEDKNAVADQDADRSYAFPIRCIRNY